jgi:hypothetical protein
MAAFAGALVATSAAQALDFTLSYLTTTETFQIPAEPTPYAADPGVDFVIHNIPAFVNGVGVIDSIQFDNLGVGGGLQSGYLGAGGPQVYSGPESAPTFHAGKYGLNGGMTLVISGPEPHAWALMISGIALAGAALRRRRARHPALA